jgi:hypothetical protein
MPKKRPPNAEATEFRTGEQQVEIARQGGIASGIARREKKATQKILQDLLNLDVESNPLLVKLAKQVGVSTDKSIHELATTVLLINTLKKGDLSDLGQLQKLLGEQTEIADTEAQKQAAFLDAVKKAVTDAD